MVKQDALVFVVLRSPSDPSVGALRGRWSFRVLTPELKKPVSRFRTVSNRQPPTSVSVSRFVCDANRVLSRRERTEWSQEFRPGNKLEFGGS